MLAAVASVLVAFALPAVVVACLLLRRREAAREHHRRELRLRLYRQIAEPALCIDCRTELDAGYRCCPGCGAGLQRPCGSCARLLHVAWSTCPYCGEGAPQEQRAAAPRASILPS